MLNYSPLLTDQYQLVMAYSYWKLGLAEKDAIFHLSFRKLPLHSSYIIVAGLEQIIHFLSNFHFTQSDVDYLKQLSIDANGEALFPAEFLQYLKSLRFTCDLDAIPEGEIVFAKEPIIRVKGPLLQCQIIETMLLNSINFASLIATKASLVTLAAQGATVIEFGLRRAQGPDGGLTASRSAYIGGCSATSNVLAGKMFNIPLNGTQAHSFIMAYSKELDAFNDFAKIMKSNTVLLVDTYDTLEGVKHAIETAKQLNQKGHELAAIRLDSGNLLDLSRMARRLLDKAGLKTTKIIASGDLDEHIIRSLKLNDAPIDAWGVGTRLVTSHDQPALNVIYKLSAIKNDEDQWDYKMKLTSNLKKATLPGILQVKRFYNDGIATHDLIYDIKHNEKNLANSDQDVSELLQPIFREGKLIYSPPEIKVIRENVMKNIALYTNFSPKPYPITLGENLQSIIEQLTNKIKSNNN